MPYQQEVDARTAVERIAAFAASARPERLTPDSRQLLKRNILDGLGRAIAALSGPPFRALREQFEEYRASGRCTLIGGGKTSADQAALFNSGLVRMSKGGLKDGKGAISTESGALKAYPYGFASRFEGQRGSSPEGLIARTDRDVGGCHAGASGRRFRHHHRPLGLEGQDPRRRSGNLHHAGRCRQGQLPGLQASQG